MTPVINLPQEALPLLQLLRQLTFVRISHSIDASCMSSHSVTVNKQYNIINQSISFRTNVHTV